MIFIVYVLIGIVTAVYAASTKNIGVPFNYEYEFTASEVLRYSLPLLIGLVFFVLGYGFRKRLRKDSYTIDIDFKISNKIILILITIQIFILFYFMVQAYIGYTELYLHVAEKNYRPLGGKIGNFLLIIQAALPVIVWKKPILRFLVILASGFIGFLFAWIDASRASVIPLSGIALFLVVNKRLVITILPVALNLFFFLLAMHARSFTDRINVETLVDIILSTFSNPFGFFSGFLSYAFTFSILQFAYVAKYQSGHFGFLDLIYSITPLPSFVLWDTDNTKWRVDIYRPMGALSEIIRVSSVAFYFFFFVFGRLAGKIDEIGFKPMKITSLCLFFLICIMVFQYNLRAVIWFIFFIIFIIVVDNKVNRRISGF